MGTKKKKQQLGFLIAVVLVILLVGKSGSIVVDDKGYYRCAKGIDWAKCPPGLCCGKNDYCGTSYFYCGSHHSLPSGSATTAPDRNQNHHA
ncbi:hypothetical protein LINGRAHAP2_LOCUS18892 [Linum grandiflorum]